MPYLGEKITSIEFSPDEKRRLAGQLRNQTSLQSNLLRTKASAIRDVTFWRQAQKAFQVKGFRDGQHYAQQIVLKRALAQVNPGLYQNSKDLPRPDFIKNLKEFPDIK